MCSEVKDKLIRAIDICKAKGIKPGYRYWNVHCRPLNEVVTPLENSGTLTSYVPATDATWVCDDGKHCEVLECLLLVEQPKYVEGWFPHHYFEAILGKDYEWINSFMAGFDGDELQPRYDRDAFLLGIEIKEYLKV